MQFLYKVTSQSDGRDCDGPITHGEQVQTLTYQELAQTIGFAFLSHGAGSVQEPQGDEISTTMIFGHNTDEGFSRTCISFYELDQDEYPTPVIGAEEHPTKRSNDHGIS